MKKILTLFLVFVLIFGCVSPKADQDQTKDQEANKSGEGSMENKSDDTSMEDKSGTDKTMDNSSEENLSDVTVGSEGQEVASDDVPEVEDDEELDEMLNEFQ